MERLMQLLGRGRLVMVVVAMVVALAGAGQAWAQTVLDPSFNPGAYANGPVYTLAVQADGKILMGGYFTQVAGVARNSIARLNADGTLDAAFNPGDLGSAAVYALAIQPDGKILMGGGFTSVAGVARNKIARLNADGSLDAAFNPGANGYVDTLALQPDGKILMGGGFTSVAGVARNYIARLNADGTLDAAFNPGANNGVRSLALQADGKILMGGDFTQVAGQARNDIARLNADGTLDAAFNPGANNSVNTLAVQPDGKILMGGDFTQVAGVARNSIARLNADGSLDAAFNPGANGFVHTLAIQPDGKIVIGGRFTQVAGQTRLYIARLNTDGSLDAAFNPGAYTSGWVSSLVVQPDGKIVMGGDFTSVAGVARNDIARLNADGTLDAAFNPGADGYVHSLAIQPDGKVVIGGSFTQVAGVARNRIARLNADGTLDAAFNPGADNSVLSLAIQPDGKIVMGGFFSQVAGVARNQIARLNADGTLDAAFNPGANSGVRSLALQPDGKILIGGDFTQVAGVTRNDIARLNADGSLDAAFNPGTNNGVESLAIQADGKIVMGGWFTQVAGVARNRIARLNADGTLDAAFNPGANSGVRSLALQPDGKIVMGGYYFTQVAGVARNQIARLNADGTLDAAFNPGANGYVLSLAVQPDGKILMGGDFTQVAGVERIGIARLFDCSYSIDPTSVNVASAGAVGSTVTVTSTPNNAACTWSATANNAWLTVTAGTPGAGSGTLTYDVAANTTAARTGTITIAGETFTVNQAVASYTLTAAKDGTGTGTVTANSGAINCGGTCSDSYIYNTVVTLTATGDAGSGFAGWAGCAIVSGNQCTVTMDAAKNVTATFNTCAYGINPASINVTAAGATGSTVTVTSTPNQPTCTWSATANNAWLTVTAGTPGTGSGTLTYNVAANGGLARSGTITIAGQTLTVNQANGCAFNLNPSMLTMANTGGNSSVNITASDPMCPWTATANNTWLTITGGTPGLGSGTLTFRVAANTGADRAGSITIAGRTFRVTQVAPAPTADCIYQIVPESAAYGHAGGQGTVWVGTQGDCLGWAWGATSRVDWVRVTGVQGNLVKYEVLANLTGQTRTGIIDIAGEQFRVEQGASSTTMTMEGNTLSCGWLRAGTVASAGIRVTNNGEAPSVFEIVGITGPGAGEFSTSTICHTLRPQDSCTLSVIYRPGTQGAKQATLTIAIDGQPYQLNLECAGVLTGAPGIAVNPDALTYTGAEIEAGVTTKAIAIENQGTSTLVVRGMELLGPSAGEFSITRNCATIPAGQSCNETLSLQRTSNSPMGAVLAVQSNDPDLPTVEVPVSVEGQAGCQDAITVAPMSIETGQAGASGVLAVTAPDECLWQALGDRDWIAADAGWHQGSGTVDYAIEATPLDTARLGQVRVGGRGVLVLQYGDGNDGSEFGDLPVEQWTHVYIKALYEAGLTNGCGQGRFCSEEYITREQAAAFIIKLLEGHPEDDYCTKGGSPFADVAVDSWSCKYIKRLHELGVESGCGDGNFCPQDDIPRDQIAALLVRALMGEGFEHNAEAYFNDVPESHWAFKYVQKLKELGFTKGCGNGNFCPGDFLQRKYLAVLMGRISLEMQ